jgi:hypothetical protein
VLVFTAGAMHSAPQLDSQGEQVGGYGVATVPSEGMGHTVVCLCVSVCVFVFVFAYVCVCICVCLLRPEGVSVHVPCAADACPLTIIGTRRRETETWRVHRHKFAQVSIKCVLLFYSVNIPFRALTREDFVHICEQNMPLYTPYCPQQTNEWDCGIFILGVYCVG